MVLILDGELSLAEAFGFRRGNDKVRVSSLTDVHNPKLRIVWGEELELPVLNCRNGLAFFAKERWTGAPMIAGRRRGAGGFFGWPFHPGSTDTSVPLSDAGDVRPRSGAALSHGGLWAFLNCGYRARVDLDYFARRCPAGIGGLHVAA